MNIVPSKISAKMRKAFSLIEAAIVLGVVGLIIGGIWIGADAVYTNTKVNQTIQGIMMIDANLNRVFNGRTTVITTAIGGSVLDGMKILDGADGFTVAGGTPLPNSILLLTYESPGHSRFNFLSAGGWIPTSYCIKIISRLTSSGISDRINYVWTTGAPNKYFFHTVFPVVPTKAECTTPTSIDIQFK